MKPIETKQDLQQQTDAIIKTYPKSIEKIKQFICKKLQEDAARYDYPQEALESSLKNITNGFAAMSVLFSPDNVFKVLDDMKVFVSVYYDETTEGFFTYTHSRTDVSSVAPSREEANRAVIEEVFQLIEDGEI